MSGGALPGVYDEECLFCKIIQGAVPSYTWYEDENHLAILDRFPVRAGHTLIIPKTHAADLFALPGLYAETLIPLARRLGLRLKETERCPGLKLVQNNVKTAGQAVAHFHLHLIPCHAGDEPAWQWKSLDPPPEEFEAVMARLR